MHKRLQPLEVVQLVQGDPTAVDDQTVRVVLVDRAEVQDRVVVVAEVEARTRSQLSKVPLHQFRLHPPQLRE